MAASNFAGSPAAAWIAADAAALSPGGVACCATAVPKAGGITSIAEASKIPLKDAVLISTLLLEICTGGA